MSSQKFLSYGRKKKGNLLWVKISALALSPQLNGKQSRNQESPFFSVDQSLCDCSLSQDITISFLRLYDRDNLAHLPKEGGRLTSDKWAEDATEIESTPKIITNLSHNLS